MIVTYAPFDEPVTCLMVGTVAIQPTAPRWREGQLIQCVHISNGHLAVIAPKTSVGIFEPEAGFELMKRVGQKFEGWHHNLAPKPWPEPPPQ